MIGKWLEIGHDAGGAVAQPLYPWVFEIGSFMVWIIIAASFVISYRRTGELSLYALIFIGATTMFWLEFPADWGAFLIYSPKFTLFPIELPFTTPNKPIWMPTAYGWYFLAIYALILFLVDKLVTAKPHISIVLAVIMIATPFFFVWNMLVEGFSTLVGWWTYYEVFGPAITSTRGTYPLVFPVIPFTIYGVIQTLMLIWKTPDGKHYIEQIAGAHTAPIGYGKELRRALAWIIAMNLIFGMFALSTFLFRLMII